MTRRAQRQLRLRLLLQEQVTGPAMKRLWNQRKLAVQLEMAQQNRYDDGYCHCCLTALLITHYFSLY